MESNSWGNLAAFISGISSFGTFVVAVIAIFGARKQLAEMDKDRTAELRPYVSIRYVLMKGKQEAAKLQFHNAGRTSARNIQLQFPKDRTWHNVKSPNFSFLGTGISVLNPGESVEFFLGPITKVSKLGELKGHPMIVKISYQDGITKQVIRDEFSVSLGDHVYALGFSTELL